MPVISRRIMSSESTLVASRAVEQEAEDEEGRYGGRKGKGPGKETRREG